MKTVKRFIIAAAALLLLSEAASLACSSVIISGKYTADGKPLMLKIRDQSEDLQNNNIQFFEGPVYSYMGTVSNAAKPHRKKGSVTAGINSAGLCVMTLTSKCFDGDSTVGKSKFSINDFALGNCKSIEEFEKKCTEYIPLGNKCNMGIIDAFGGAAYYEFNGHAWTKYDVNDPAVAPEGWYCMTNYSKSGDLTRGGGFDRCQSAESIMRDFKKNADGKYTMTAQDLWNAFGRVFRNETVGVRDLDDIAQFKMFCSTGFMIRSNTCAMLTFEGVPAGTDPKYTILWNQLGNPVCAPVIPMLATEENMIPDYIWKEGEKSARIFDKSWELRNKYIFPLDYPSGRLSYFDVAAVKNLISVTRKSEKYIVNDFYAIFSRWKAGKMTDKKFYKEYQAHLPLYYKSFLTECDNAGL